MSAVLGLLLGAGARLGRETVERRNALHPELVKGTVKESLSDLTKAFKAHVNDKKSFDVDSDVQVNLETHNPLELDVYLKEAHNNRDNVKFEKPGVPNYINLPDNASANELAEDLGQLAYKGTTLGKFFAGADKYKEALAIAASMVPAGYALLNPGHNDFGASMVLATALNSPQLAKSLGSKYHALRMMDKAKMPTVGPSMRLAGSALLDLNVPLIQASAGNIVGNMFDAPNYDFNYRDDARL